MKIIDVTIEPYQLPLRYSLRIGGVESRERVGFYCFLHTDTGLVGKGEISPLPGLHLESYDEAFYEFERLKDELVNLELSDIVIENLKMLPQALFPSVQFGVDMCMLDICWQCDGIYTRLFSDKRESNGLIIPGCGDLFQQITQLVNNGYTSIKIKVGRQSLKDDIELINSIIKMLPVCITLRLDANRLWSKEQAIEFLSAIDSSVIEYIEEPTSDWKEFEEIYTTTKVYTALDESLSFVDALEDYNGIGALVVKPGFDGGILRILELNEHACQHNLKYVLTSTFQSSYSIMFISALANYFSFVPVPYGLDTLRWF